MVVKNPLFSGRWTAKKFGATVLDDTWPEVTFFTLFATVIVLVSKLTETNLGVSNQLLTVLGLVLGLVISFRTSSAYERYQDGRKMWSNIAVASRHLAQMIWIHVPIDRPTPAADSKEKAITPLEAALEKKAMINMVQAFSVSVKHLLRGEQGPYYEDLYPLVAFLPKFATPEDERVGRESDKLPLWHFRDQQHRLVDTATQAAALMVIPEVEPMEMGAHVTGHRRGGSDSTVVGDETEKEPLSLSQRHVAKSSSQDYPSDIGAPARKRRFSFYRVAPPNATYDPYVVLPRVESPFPLLSARNPPSRNLYHFFPVLKLFRWCWQLVTLKKKLKTKEEREEARLHSRRKAYAEIVESHIPLEICLVLSNYTNYVMKKGLVQPAIATGLTNALVSFQDALANLERICNTPLPFAYQAHLRMSLWLYLLLLPFQLYLAFGYITIPATAFASFLLVGFLEIGQEIENPFNYDLNDLDLDLFCLAIQRDLNLITAHTNPNPHDYLFTKLNQPLAPNDRRNAAELAKNSTYTHPNDNESEPGLPSLRKALLESWKETDTSTRKS
ncbi:Bestrophin, RFP-TM, chloride channel-domain-containing protein [Crepidotus variabilis]|uniref:Bestrophin, RFP-TM, chloride channel-domain-containing protein n=1 Tax=Crepidotus variabilis TaxID=179855 RepID=A0A9P6EA02_9AGAR|nr:Bestrophin, RFP-TM, chloride channel-domain-containing protein [Crepidotus variabilis]